MQAPDLATLYNIQDPVQNGLQPRLNGILATHIMLGTEDLPGDRIDVTLIRGRWSGKWGVRTNGKLAESAWNVTLTIALHSTRQPGAMQNINAHLSGEIRAAIFAAAEDPAFLQYHTLVKLHELSGTETVAEDEQIDANAIVFTGIVVIRSDAWPDES